MVSNSLKIGIGILIVCSALFCVLPTDISFIRIGANYTVHIMFANLALGLLFLILNERKLLFTSFAACAFLCLFLKSSSNNVLKLSSKTIQESLNVAQLNITSTHEHIYETIESIKNTNVQILSIQEIAPDMAILLKKELNELYPYNVVVHRKEDFLGIGIYSKIPFQSIDTFYVDDIPNLAVNVSCSNQKTVVISSYVYPELSSNDNSKILAQFKTLEAFIAKQTNPVIAIGDFNQLQFSNYLKDLKRESLLNDSRRFQFLDNPTDHILFSSHFDCVEFQTISNRFANHLGIKGSYQLNNTSANVQKSNTKF